MSFPCVFSLNPQHIIPYTMLVVPGHNMAAMPPGLSVHALGGRQSEDETGKALSSRILQNLCLINMAVVTSLYRALPTSFGAWQCNMATPS